MALLLLPQIPDLFPEDLLSFVARVFKLVSSSLETTGFFHEITPLLAILLGFVTTSALLPVSLFFYKRTLHKHEQRVHKVDETGNERKLQELRVLRSQHEAAYALADLCESDGAGEWPPKANHTAWPAALRPYKEVYLAMVPHLPAAKPSLDDSTNDQQRIMFRSRMRKLLAEKVSIFEVEEIMRAVEQGYWTALPQDAYNGFYSCVAVCRHAYRYVIT